jgi:hypothetical protein
MEPKICERLTLDHTKQYFVKIGILETANMERVVFMHTASISYENIILTMVGFL